MEEVFRRNRQTRYFGLMNNIFCSCYSSDKGVCSRGETMPLSSRKLGDVVNGIPETGVLTPQGLLVSLRAQALGRNCPYNLGCGLAMKEPRNFATVLKRAVRGDPRLENCVSKLYEKLLDY
jgi:hypothetical protein